MAGRFSCQVEAPTEPAKSFIAEVAAEGIQSTTLAGGDVIWLAGLEPPSQLLWHLEHTISIRTDEQRAKRRQALAGALAEIGFHPIEARTPDGTPDPRIGVVSRWPAGASRPHVLRPDDLFTDVRATATIKAVPIEVEEVMRRARLLYLGGWQAWELFTLAAREAAFALEASLRRLSRSADGSTTTPSFKMLIDRAPASLLTHWERQSMHRFRERRNLATHPSDTPPLQWIGQAQADVAKAVDLINRMWARRESHLPSFVAQEVDT
jgi:hypothetical protein